MSDQPLEAQYKKARRSYEQRKYPEAASILEELLKSILARIVRDYHVDLSESEDFKDAVTEIDPATRIDEWNLQNLTLLFDKMNIFRLCGGELSKSEHLLCSYRYRELAYLCSMVKDGTCEEQVKKLGLQQALNAIVALLRALDEIPVRGVHFLVNTLELGQYVSRSQDRKEQEESLEAYTSYLLDEKVGTGKGTKVFEIIKVRGMLINTEDKSRNISFKVETLVRILTTIHDAARRELIKQGVKDFLALKHAQWILFSAGYTSGVAFGRALHEIFRQEIERMSLEQKIERWCFFDSDVGFGLFSAEKVEENDDSLDIVIRLSDSFLVHGKGAEDTNLCAFMCGYVQGILEVVTRMPLIITHSKKECEQYSPKMRSCIFRVTRDAQRFLESISRTGEEEQKWGGEGMFTPPRIRETEARVPVGEEETHELIRDA